MKAVFCAALTLAAPAAAQIPDWSKAERISIVMTSQGYQPSRITLHRGVPYVLSVTNRSDKGHNLTQKAFFSLARIAPRDRYWVRDGQIVLKPGERAIVRFQAPNSRPGGRYEFSSTTLGDADSVYTGSFVMR